MRALLVMGGVALLSCGPARLPGAPEPGKACTDEVAECSSSASISICESGKWAAYPCPSACSNAQTPRCDWSKAQVGQACPASFEGAGGVACNAAGNALIGCRSGKWAEVTCPVCRKGPGGFTCA